MWDTKNMEFATVPVGEIKSDSLGRVRGYLVRFGDQSATDLEGDFFTAQTDFGFPIEPGRRIPLNVYYHHGMDPVIGRKSIGTGYLKLTDEGLWYEAQLDLADDYALMVAKLCKQGKMGYSSGAAGHLVERKSVGAATEITRWPIAEASITPTPAEWRNNVKALPEMYDESDGEDDQEMELEVEVEPVNGADPTTFASNIFDNVPVVVLHEGLETLYDTLCAGIMAVADLDSDQGTYVAALLDEFDGRARALLSGADLKSWHDNDDVSLRVVERRLRDAFGMSRSSAKRLAPEIRNARREAEPKPVVENIVENGTGTSPVKDLDRSALLDRLTILELL
jgi:hypothetical protein